MKFVFFSSRTLSREGSQFIFFATTFFFERERSETFFTYREHRYWSIERPLLRSFLSFCQRESIRELFGERTAREREARETNFSRERERERETSFRISSKSWIRFTHNVQFGVVSVSSQEKLMQTLRLSRKASWKRERGMAIPSVENQSRSLSTFPNASLYLNSL